MRPLTYWVATPPKQTPASASTPEAIHDVGNANNIIIRASDTDIAVIMLHHAWKFSATLWMDTGTANGKNRRYVNLSAIAMSIGSKTCQALLAYRAFTWTDYTSAIIRKGKVMPFRRLKSRSDAQDALIAITPRKVDASSERALLKFGATLFGAKAAESSSLNGFAIWRSRRRSDQVQPQRTDYADQQTIDQHPTPENGWDLVNNQYDIIWFEGLQLLDILIPDREDAQCEDDDSAVVLSSDDETGELSSENDDDDYWSNRRSNCRPFH